MLYLNSVYGSLYVPSIFHVPIIFHLFMVRLWFRSCSVGYVLAICRLCSVYTSVFGSVHVLSMFHPCSVFVPAIFPLWFRLCSVYSFVFVPAFFCPQFHLCAWTQMTVVNIGMLLHSHPISRRMGLDGYCSDEHVFIHLKFVWPKLGYTFLSGRFLLSGHKPDLHLPLRVILVSFTSHSSFLSSVYVPLFLVQISLQCLLYLSIDTIGKTITKWQNWNLSSGLHLPPRVILLSFKSHFSFSSFLSSSIYIH